jgi:hypothetical protein
MRIRIQQLKLMRIRIRIRIRNPGLNDPDPDPGGPKSSGSNRFGSATLPFSFSYEFSPFCIMQVTPLHLMLFASRKIELLPSCLVLILNCLMIERSESGSIPLTNGSGSWRPKIIQIRQIWIRIRIRNTLPFSSSY